MPTIDVHVDSIPVGTPTRLEDEGTSIVILRTEKGITAFPDSCPHARWRLSDGELSNGILECPGHGWEFDAASGACLTVPTYCLKPFPIQIDGGHLRIEC
jgi:nitrite reductase/ring-hydroxylating ferredoxin subunit